MSGYGGGGGYLSQQSPGGYGSQQSPGGEKKANAHALRPVSIAQVINATQGHAGDEGFVIDGTPVTMFTVVAQVLSVNNQTTADVFKIQDGSGEIDARHWIDSKSSSEDDRLDENAYRDKFVRFIGTIRSFQNRRHINAQVVRILDDQNEAYFHFNEVMAVTLYHRYGTPKELSGGGAPAKTSASNYQQQSNSNNIDDNSHADLPPIQRAVVQYMQRNAPGPDEGWHVRTIARGVLDATKNANDVAEAIDKLTELGLLYSTDDSNHYALAL